jgi:hypothetical protein
MQRRMLSEVKNAKPVDYSKTFVGINNVTHTKAGVPVENLEAELTLQVKATTRDKIPPPKKPILHAGYQYFDQP